MGGGGLHNGELVAVQCSAVPHLLCSLLSLIEVMWEGGKGGTVAWAVACSRHVLQVC